MGPWERITKFAYIININLEQVGKPRGGGGYGKEDFFSIFVGIVGFFRYILDII